MEELKDTRNAQRKLSVLLYRKVTDAIEQQKIDKIIGNINQHYSYNSLDLDELKDAIATVGLRVEFIKSFDFMDDITVRYNFEKENQLDIFEGQNINPADWLEIKCIDFKFNTTQQNTIKSTVSRRFNTKYK